MAGLNDEDLVELTLDDIKNSCGFGLDIGNYQIVSKKTVAYVDPLYLNQGHYQKSSQNGCECRVNVNL